MDHAASLSAVLQSGTRLQQSFEIYPHHTPAHAVVLKPNYLAQPLALAYLSTFVRALSYKNGRR